MYLRRFFLWSIYTLTDWAFMDGFHDKKINIASKGLWNDQNLTLTNIHWLLEDADVSSISLHLNRLELLGYFV